MNKNYRSYNVGGATIFVEHERDGIDFEALTVFIRNRCKVSVDTSPGSPLVQIVEFDFSNGVGDERCVTVGEGADVFYAQPFGQYGASPTRRYLKYVRGIKPRKTSVVTTILLRQQRDGVVGRLVIGCFWGSKTPMTPDNSRLAPEERDVVKAFWRNHALIDTTVGYDCTTVTSNPPPGWE